MVGGSEREGKLRQRFAVQRRGELVDSRFHGNDRVGVKARFEKILRGPAGDPTRKCRLVST